MSFMKSDSLKKIAVTCILLGTIPSITVGLFSSHRAAQTIQRKVNEDCVGQLQQVQMSVETQLSSIRKTLLQFIESPTITQSVNTKKNGSEFQSFNSIEDVISGLPTAGMSIYNVGLINVNQKWVLNQTEIYDLDDFEELNPGVSSYINNPNRFFWDNHALIKNSSNQTTVNCISAVQKYSSGGNVFIGKIDIPYESIGKLIHTNSATGKIMILDKDGKVIYSDSLEAKIQKELAAQIKGMINPRQNSLEKTTAQTDSGLWNISYTYSGYNGWYYVLATPMADITRESNAIMNFAFSVCGALTLMIVAASLLISKFAYQPIQRIDNALNKGEILPDSETKGEIQQIEERVNRLISDHSDMKMKISFQSQKLEEYSVMKLLTAENSYDLLKNSITLFGLPDPPPTMAILVIQPNLLNQTQYHESDLDIILYSIDNIFKEMFAQNSIALSSVVSNRMIAILSADTEYKESAHEAASRLQQILQNQLELEVSIIISRPVAGYREIHKNYNECLDTLYYRFLEDKSIAFVEDGNSSMSQNSIYPKELEEEIIDCVKNCDRIKCGEMIHQFINSIFDIQSNQCVYKIYLEHLIISLIIIHTQTGTEACQNDLEFLKQLYVLHGKEEIERWLQNTVAETLMSQIEKSADCHLKEICDSVLNIVHEGYCTKLTLESCAKKLNYHPSYIRRVLKKEMGINFRDYLLNYRINIAKKWMLETEMSINEIAQKLQYENTENFVRSFKKTVGCTPKQYRDRKNAQCRYEA